MLLYASEALVARFFDHDLAADLDADPLLILGSFDSLTLVLLDVLFLVVDENVDVRNERRCL